MDLPIWYFVIFGFKAELDCVIFIDSELYMNHLRGNWNYNPFHMFILCITI